MYPVLINLPFLKIHSYGVMMAIAFAVTIYYCYKRVEKSGLGINGDQLLTIATYLILFSMAGARITYVIQFWNEFQGDWLAIFLFKQREGFVFFGGLLGGLFYLFWYFWKYKLNFYKFMDFIFPVSALGYAIGRLGCFLNGCCYGVCTDVPWAVVFPHHPGEFRHPTQIYEMLFGITLFFFLKYWYEHKRTFSGQTFFIGMMAYAVERFLIELIRINPEYFWFTQAQWIALIIFIFSLAGYWYRFKKADLVQ